MTTTTQAPAPALVEPILDGILLVLIEQIQSDETNRSEASVTLVTPGAVVHGQLISRQAWVTEWENIPFNGNSAEYIAALPRGAFDAIAEIRQENGVEESYARFVHLRDVVILAGPTSISTQLWRGRLADISGWSIGRPS